MFDLYWISSSSGSFRVNNGVCVCVVKCGQIDICQVTWWEGQKIWTTYFPGSYNSRSSFAARHPKSTILLDTSGWSINFKACDVKKTKSLVYPANFDKWNQRWVVVLSHRLTAISQFPTQIHMKIIISAKDRCNNSYMITLMKIYANFFNIFTITMNFFASSLYIKTWEPLAHILIITKGCKINRENLQKKELQKHKKNEKFFH